MTLNAKRDLIFAFAPVVEEAVATYGRRGAHFLFEVLRGAYDTYMERAQMRLVPVKPRSWREIPRAGAHYDCCRARARVVTA